LAGGYVLKEKVPPKHDCQ